LINWPAQTRITTLGVKKLE